MRCERFQRVWQGVGCLGGNKSSMRRLNRSNRLHLALRLALATANLVAYIQSLGISDHHASRPSATEPLLNWFGTCHCSAA